MRKAAVWIISLTGLVISFNMNAQNVSNAATSPNGSYKHQFPTQSVSNEGTHIKSTLVRKGGEDYKHAFTQTSGTEQKFRMSFQSSKRNGNYKNQFNR